MGLYLTNEQLAREKSEIEKRGFKSNFIEPEHVGGAALAALMDSIYENKPNATLDDVQAELDHFGGVIAEFQEAYGEDAPMSLIA